VLRIAESRSKRFIGFIALCSLGSVQLFFGYIEVYGAVAAVIMAWLCLGSARNLGPRHLPLMGLFLGLVSFLHISLLSLFPSLVALSIMVCTRRRRHVRIATIAGTL